MRHVRWIGGATGAGNATAARKFAHRYRLRPYVVDHRNYQHAALLAESVFDWARPGSSSPRRSWRTPAYAST
ncbi:MAG: hypothetical protein M3082_07650 [Candidatus Dormibacteraeota bacterium]|nr:hypothetical protein [Candidatus Dormibacteraeota bacterium]